MSVISLTCLSVASYLPNGCSNFNLVFFVLKVTYVRVFLDMFDENRLSRLKVVGVESGRLTECLQIYSDGVSNETALKENIDDFLRYVLCR